MSSKLTLLSKLPFGGNLVLKNRVALSPLTRGRCGRSQIPNKLSVDYYTQRASAGLVITEGTIPSKRGMGWAGAAAIYAPEHVEGWKKVTESVHKADGVIFCQLWHMGRVTSSAFHDIKPIGASPIAAKGQVTLYDGSKVPYEVPRPLELSEMKDVVEEYRVAAQNAKEAGFDGVEIHGANGYLLDIFLQSVSNHRSDKYGGSFENRFRLMGEVIEGVGTVFPSNRIGVRLSPNGNFGSMGSPDNYEAFTYYISQLNKFDLAYLHMLDGLGFGWHELCKQVKLADARKHYDGVIIGNVGYEKLTAEGAINSGGADMIAFGRPYISNPDLVERFANDWPLAPPADQKYWWWYDNFPDGDASKGYTDFPTYKEAQGKK
jgi:N-ethylmaleimide reductase